MFLKHVPSGDLVEVIDLPDVIILARRPFGPAPIWERLFTGRKTS